MGEKSLQIIGKHDIGKSVDAFQRLYKSAMAYRKKNVFVTVPEYVR